MSRPRAVECDRFRCEGTDAHGAGQSVRWLDEQAAGDLGAGHGRGSASTPGVKDMVLPGNFAGNVLEVGRYVSMKTLCFQGFQVKFEG